MLASSIPTAFALPFGASAGASYIRTIPVDSQISITPGAASLTDGFPPLNFVDPLAGGVPMSGKDLNGILNEITAGVQWIQAGGMPVYSSTFSTAIGGYPNGAVLRMTNGKGLWISTVDNNISDPDASGANWYALSVSNGEYLSISVAGAANVTLTAVQSVSNIINLSGAITANINVIVPTETNEWTFRNSTTGAFTVTVKTSAGTGIVIPQGTSLKIWCDAVNVASSTSGATTTVITAASDPTFANSSTSAASTNWVRGAMSAIATAAGFVASLAANGYVKFPSWLGGVVVQWGTSGSVAIGINTAITFPLTFPSAVTLVTYMSNASGNASPAQQSGTSSKTTSGFTFWSNNSTTSTYSWIAIGY